MDKAKILIAEDESIIALELKMRLTSHGYDVVNVVSSGENAIKEAEKEQINLILMDVKLQGGIDGIDAGSVIRKNKDVAIVYMSANSEILESDRLQATCPQGLLTKPIFEWELFEIIEKGLQKYYPLNDI